MKARPYYASRITKEEAKEATAFCMRVDLYERKVMLLGLCNIPVTTQARKDDPLYDILPEGIVINLGNTEIC